LKKVLIIGYGSMGKLHSKYLEQMKVHWRYYDPFVLENKERSVLDLDSISDFTHVIIATPTSHHREYLEKIRNSFKGRVFVEKPGVMSLDDLDLIKDEKVSVGMVERFNPSYQTLYRSMNQEDVLCIDFIRCSALPVSRIEVNSFIDVGIHDIDLLCQMFPNISIEDMTCFRNQNTFAMNIKFNKNKIARFMWSNETFHKDRKIHVRQKNYNLECNLSDQTVKKYYLSENHENIVKDVYVEKKSSILGELEYFVLEDGRIDALNSHKVFLKMINENSHLRES